MTVKKQITAFLTLLLSFGQLYGQNGGEIRLTEVSSLVLDDSLRVRFILTANDLLINSRESLTLFPCVVDGKISVSLPAVVYSGKFRQKYDERKRFFAAENSFPIYRTYTDVSESETYRLRYEAAIPYSSRLQASKLVIKYRYDDCCSDKPVFREESYALGFVAPPKESPTVHDTIYITQTVAEPSLAAITAVANRKREMLHLEYPSDEHHIIKDYALNEIELRRLDNLLSGHRGAIRVTAYASPDGPYYKNKILAENRAEGFRKYLSQHYRAISVRMMEHVPEDWDGLRKLINASNLAGKLEAMEIIDKVDIFSGREKMLLDLRGGDFWKKLLPYFKQLRRIEVEIIE